MFAVCAIEPDALVPVYAQRGSNAAIVTSFAFAPLVLQPVSGDVRIAPFVPGLGLDVAAARQLRIDGGDPDGWMRTLFATLDRLVEPAFLRTIRILAAEVPGPSIATALQIVRVQLAEHCSLRLRPLFAGQRDTDAAAARAEIITHLTQRLSSVYEPTLLPLLLAQPAALAILEQRADGGYGDGAAARSLLQWTCTLRYAPSDHPLQDALHGVMRFGTPRPQADVEQTRPGVSSLASALMQFASVAPTLDAELHVLPTLSVQAPLAERAAAVVALRTVLALAQTVADARPWEPEVPAPQRPPTFIVRQRNAGAALVIDIDASTDCPPVPHIADCETREIAASTSGTKSYGFIDADGTQLTLAAAAGRPRALRFSGLDLLTDLAVDFTIARNDIVADGQAVADDFILRSRVVDGPTMRPAVSVPTLDLRAALGVHEPTRTLTAYLRAVLEGLHAETRATSMIVEIGAAYESQIAAGTPITLPILLVPPKQLAWGAASTPTISTPVELADRTASAIVQWFAANEPDRTGTLAFSLNVWSDENADQPPRLAIARLDLPASTVSW
jgi:hypothetical protein